MGGARSIDVGFALVEDVSGSTEITSRAQPSIRSLRLRRKSMGDWRVRSFVTVVNGGSLGNLDGGRGVRFWEAV